MFLLKQFHYMKTAPFQDALHARDDIEIKLFWCLSGKSEVDLSTFDDVVNKEMLVQSIRQREVCSSNIKSGVSNTDLTYWPILVKKSGTIDDALVVAVVECVDSCDLRFRLDSIIQNIVKQLFAAIIFVGQRLYPKLNDFDSRNLSGGSFDKMPVNTSAASKFSMLDAITHQLVNRSILLSKSNFDALTVFSSCFLRDLAVLISSELRVDCCVFVLSDDNMGDSINVNAEICKWISGQCK
jgi:hypothetical protein